MCIRDRCDDVGGANQNAEGTSNSDKHDIASSQQVAEEQRNDETLAGCFKLAKAGKGGFEIHNNLLYHRITLAGESFLQLVVPKARRKHVLKLDHDVFGGHMAVKRTKERIESSHSIGQHCTMIVASMLEHVTCAK